MSGLNIAGPATTLGAQLRRLAAEAKNNNPVELPALQGSRPWIALKGAYPGDNAHVIAGDLYSNAGHAYLALAGGVTGQGTAPTGTSLNTGYSDGGVTWIYYGFAIGEQVSNRGGVFEVKTGGLPATSGNGPSPASLIDGTIVWTFAGGQSAPVLTMNAAHNPALSKLFDIRRGLGPLELISDNSGVVRFEGGVPFNGGSVNAVYVGGPNIAPARSNCINGPGGNIACEYASYTVLTNAPKIEFLLTTSSHFNVMVDNRYAFGSSEWISVPTPFLQLDFTNAGGAKTREIKIEASSSNGLAQIAVAPSDQVSYPVKTDNFGVAFAGTSLSTGTRASSAAKGWNNVFRYLVGLPDFGNFAIGGTGLIAPGASTPFIPHIPGDLARYSAFRGPPKVVFIEAPANNVSYPSAEITAATVNLVKTLRSTYPNALIVGVGSTFGSKNVVVGHPAPVILVAENAMIAGFAQLQAAGDPLLAYIRNSSLPSPPGPVITGSGKQTTVDGSCNPANATGSRLGDAWLDVSEDGGHNNDCGYLAWAQAAAAQWSAIIDSLP